MRSRLSFIRALLFMGALALPAAGISAPPVTPAEVHAPLWVGRPPSDAVSGLVRLENGELRHYDYGLDPTPEIHHHPDFLATSYICSLDQGFTWQTKKVPQGHYGADMRSPVSGEYMRLQTKADGVYVIKTKGGIDGEWTMRRVWETPIRSPELNLTRSLVFINGGRRVLSPWSTMRRFGVPSHQAGVIYSDDDGETWKHSNLVDAPAHEINERDKSVRWQNGATEPTVIDLKDGRLWMIIRTSLDYHYQSFSNDGGVTWSTPEPSPFYGTVTDPTIGRLQDGRLLFLWNNTLPLPEFPKNEFTAPFIPQSAADGTGEDVFTNRDALHAAISDDDGKTWKGFREVLLNSRRNDSNYGETRGIDRSVHQPQFVQVEAGRVLVSTGQHWLHRSLFLFDPDWLLETKRNSDFSNGLDDWSVHGYLKGIRGHCSLNRYESSMLVPHPDKPKSRVLQVSRTDNAKAIFPSGGATWNFPLAAAGKVETRIRLGPGFGGARISLLDRWMNPTDPTVADLAMCHLDIAADASTSTGANLKLGLWHTLSLRWRGTAKDTRCEVLLDGKTTGKPLTFQRPANHGITYIHYQSTAAEADNGLLIESVNAEASAR